MDGFALGAVALLVINLMTYSAFAWDKRRAAQSGQRVPEATLLQLALIGGSPAAKLAQRRLRHKTHKMPFARRLNGIIAVQVFLLSASALWVLYSGTV